MPVPVRGERKLNSTQMPRWVPNLFTLLRLLLVPFVIRAMWTGKPMLALALFAAAAFTDVVDGALARRFALDSRLGAYLDPIADKCLLSGVFLALAVAGQIPWWLVAVIFGRDIYILAGAALLLTFTAARKFSPSVWGKASTFVQVVTAVAWLTRNLLETPVLVAFSSGMLWACTVFTIWSGLDYTWRGIELARAH